MPNFEFIEDQGFRASLDSDYAEMHRCFDSKAWKSVQVLGGSIVEALLIDYLVATGAARTGKDPMKMDLADAVAICRSEKVLTERTADLCSVIRSYRNLIHAGRMVRLKEDLPSESSARIAVALIEIICDEVAKVRQSEFGLTGEQIVAKIERDSNAVSILKHLLQDVTTRQKERILLELLPTRYFELCLADEGLFSERDHSEAIRDLRRAFRVVFEASPDALKAKSAQQFVTTLREADGYQVVAYAEAFFAPSNLEYLPVAQHPLIKEFFFSRIGNVLQAKDLETIHGIEKYLTEEDVHRWIDPVVRALISSTVGDKDQSAIRLYFLMGTISVPSDLEAKVEARLNTWVKTFTIQNREIEAEITRKLLSDWQDGTSLPF